MIVYLNGEFLPKSEAHISPDDRGFLLADGVYEVTRSYQGHLFALDRHLARLDRSLKEMQLEQPEVDFAQVSRDLLAKNDLMDGDATVYIQVTRGVATRTHAFPKERVVPTVYGYAVPFAPVLEKWTNGIDVITAPDIRWARCDIKSIALLPNVLAQQQAQDAGVEETILIRDGVVTEGAHTSVCGIVDGVLFTHPNSNYILPGITRGIVLELCEALDIPVRPFPILAHKLKDVDELMILGTASEVMPVVEVDGRKVGSGKPGPVTKRLHEAYKKLVADEMGKE